MPAITLMKGSHFLVTFCRNVQQNCWHPCFLWSVSGQITWPAMQCVLLYHYNFSF